MFRSSFGFTMISAHRTALHKTELNINAETLRLGAFEGLDIRAKPLMTVLWNDVIIPWNIKSTRSERFQRLFVLLEARVQSQMPWFSKKMFAIAYNDLKRSQNTDSNKENRYYSISHEAYFAKVIYVSWTWNNFSGNKRQPQRSRCTFNYFKWILKYNKTFFFSEAAIYQEYQLFYTRPYCPCSLTKRIPFVKIRERITT